MSYIARSDIELLFGKRALYEWSDLDGEHDDVAVEARIAAAITSAEALTNDLLRGGPYAVPITETLPETVKNACAQLAGVKAYESKGVADTDAEGRPTHRFSAIRKDAEMKLVMIRHGEIQLDLPETTRIPEVGSVT